MNRHGYSIPDEVLGRDVTASTESSEDVQRALGRLYQEDATLVPLCERLVDLDEGMQEWRYRHVKMVERTIGDQPGTGGSPGVAYLRKTLFMPLFPDLWAIRSRF